MFKEEAQWIEKAIKKITPLKNDNRVANLGSSTKQFRTIVQPHIQNHIILPLENAGWQLIHIDSKKDEGVDIVADITHPNLGEQCKAQFALTICTNMLEHVKTIESAVKNLIAITKNSGYIMVTVPFKYKLHFDPIDNGFRPTPQQIINLFESVLDNVIDSKIIVIKNSKEYKIKTRRWGIKDFRERIKFYFGKRYKVSAVLLKIKK